MGSTDKGEKTRQKIMDAIIGYVEKHQYAPSLNEIGEMVGIQKTTVHSHMKKLIAEGRLETDSYEYMCLLPRAYRVPGYRLVKEQEERHG